MTTRLATIATAQKKTRIRDFVFACFVVVGAALAVTSTAAAAEAASTVSTR
jgi:hypothetical protein